MKQRLVLVGNGMAGMRTIEELLAIAPEQYQITVFGAEPYGNYNRIMLSAVLAGDKTLEDIVINDRAWYAAHNIILYSGTDKAVVSIDRQQRKVIAQDGTTTDYDCLLIATGSTAIMPNVPGVTLAGVISFRDIVDVNKMLDYAQHAQHAVVLGGGLLGLEAANGLALRGMSVTVIHNNATLLNRQLDDYAGGMLQAQLAQKGIEFKLAAKLSSLQGDADGHIRQVQLDDGTVLTCDLFIAAIGITPNISLAKKANLFCERGIVVDDHLQTEDPYIYAVGECIQHRGQTFGLVAPLFEQAKVCASHLSQQATAGYVTLPTATKLKVTGINLFSIGNFQGDASTETLTFKDLGAGIYKKLIIKNNQLIGAVLYGDTTDGPWYQSLLETNAPLTDHRETLMFGNLMQKG